MKKILIISAAIMAMTAMSCTKTQLPADETLSLSGKTMKVTASLVDVTKTYMTEPEQNIYKIKWAEKDSIIVNGYKSGGTTLINDGLSAEFIIPVEAEASYYCAMYPHQMYVKASFDDGACKVYVTSTQSYVEGSYDPSAAIIAAYSDDPQKLHFQQLMAYYKLTFQPGNNASANIANIVVSRAGNDKFIAGTYTINFGETCTLTPASMTKVINYSCGEAGIPTNSSVVIALPARDYSNDGLTFAVTDLDGNTVSYLVKPDLSEKAGIVLEKTLEFDPKPVQIMTVEDWEEFAAASNEGTASPFTSAPVVALGADLEAATFTQVKNLPCTFDGAGHTIKATAGKNALFGKIGGSLTVKNLIVDGTFTSQSVFCETLTGTATTDLANIQDCINNAKITVQGDVDAKVGAFASSAAWATMTRCQNNGDINVNVSGYHEINVGGLVDHIYMANNGYSFTMTDCKNSGKINVYADISSKGVRYFSVGGVAGWVSRDYVAGKWPEVKFINCDNEGEITVDATEPDIYYFSTTVGGILGRSWGDWYNDSSNGGANDNYMRQLGVPGPTKDGKAITHGNCVKSTFIDCDNSGNILNKVTSGVGTQQYYQKPFTGGIVGAFYNVPTVYTRAAGGAEVDITMKNCTSTGNVSGCNVTDADGYKKRGGVETVAGGLVGIGSHIYFKSCVVTGTLGNAGSNAFAVSGGMGAVVGSTVYGICTFDECTICPSIIHLCKFPVGQYNWSLLATVTKYVGTVTPNQKMNFAGSANPLPMSGSMIVKNCQLGVVSLRLNTEDPANFFTLPSSSKIEECNSLYCGSIDNCEAHAIQGNDAIDGALTCFNAKASGVATYSGNSCISAAPSVPGTPVPAPMSE